MPLPFTLSDNLNVTFPSFSVFISKSSDVKSNPVVNVVSLGLITSLTFSSELPLYEIFWPPILLVVNIFSTFVSPFLVIFKSPESSILILVVLSPCLNVTLPMFCRSLASLTVNFLFSLSEATVILLVAVSVGALSPSPTTDSVFPNETSLSSPVFPANLSTFPSTYAFTTLLLASLDPSILVSPSFSTHLSSVILLASTFAYPLKSVLSAFLLILFSTVFMASFTSLTAPSVAALPMFVPVP